MSQNKFPSIIVFDVNETLLDITTLEPLFERVFGDQAIMREWFAQLVLYSQTMTLSGLYVSFGELGVGALKMVATIHQTDIADSDVAELKERLSNMPAHPDVIPALTRLRDAGFRLVTLTNSPSSASPTPLEKAGLSQFLSIPLASRPSVSSNLLLKPIIWSRKHCQSTPQTCALLPVTFGIL